METRESKISHMDYDRMDLQEKQLPENFVNSTCFPKFLWDIKQTLFKKIIVQLHTLMT